MAATFRQTRGRAGSGPALATSARGSAGGSQRSGPAPCSRKDGGPHGSPPQHETFDPKPDAPAEVRGEIGSIPSAVPGLRVCELLPRVAGVMDRATVVRSMTHPYAEHGVAYAVSGPANRERLEAITKTVYEQVDKTGARKL